MITGYVKGQELSISAPVLVAETIDYMSAQFIFQTSEWSGMRKWAHFAQGDTVYDIELTDDRIPKSAPLNLSEGDWSVCLHGSRTAGGDVTERITTETREITVIPYPASEGDPLPLVPAGTAEQILAAIGDTDGLSEATLVEGINAAKAAAESASVKEVFTVTVSNGSADKSSIEICAAFAAGKLVWAISGTNMYYLMKCSTMLCVFSKIQQNGYQSSVLLINGRNATVNDINLQKQTVTDGGGYFTATTVEGILREIGGRLAALEG